jgi:hypothetical protein
MYVSSVNDFKLTSLVRSVSWRETQAEKVFIVGAERDSERESKVERWSVIETGRIDVDGKPCSIGKRYV